MKELQVEKGNYTRITNPLIEELIKIPFKGCELAVALFIIRKTYGFQKKQDEISLTQFESGLGRSRQTIVTALKNLQLVNVVRLVKRGDSRKVSNLWEINKYYDTWKLVNMARLVKRKRGTSLTDTPKLVVTARHTKENKRNTKEKIPFNNFWDLYDKRVGKPKSEAKWKKLTLKEQQDILKYIPQYKKACPDKTYRKNPETFFNNRSWEDELVVNKQAIEEERKAKTATAWAGDMPLYGDDDIETKLKKGVIKFNQLKQSYEKVI